METRTEGSKVAASTTSRNNDRKENGKKLTVWGTAHLPGSGPGSARNRSAKSKKQNGVSGKPQVSPTVANVNNRGRSGRRGRGGARGEGRGVVNGAKSKQAQQERRRPKPRETFSLLDLSPALQNLVKQPERKKKEPKKILQRGNQIPNSSAKLRRKNGAPPREGAPGAPNRTSQHGIHAHSRDDAKTIPGGTSNKKVSTSRRPPRAEDNDAGEGHDSGEVNDAGDEKKKKKRKPTKMKRIIRRERLEHMARDIVNSIVANIVQSSQPMKKRKRKKQRSPLESFLFCHHPRRHQDHAREYCRQIISPSLNEKVESFLKELQKLQLKTQLKSQQKEKSSKGPGKLKLFKRRYVCGMREVMKLLQTKKIKHVVMAPSIEKVKTEGGLDDLAESILKLCDENGTPITFALNRKTLGKALLKKSKISMVGILDTGGVGDLYFQMASLSERLREQWHMFQHDKFYHDPEFLKEFEGPRELKLQSQSQGSSSSSKTPVVAPSKHGNRSRGSQMKEKKSLDRKKQKPRRQNISAFTEYPRYMQERSFGSFVYNTIGGVPFTGPHGILEMTYDTPGRMEVGCSDRVFPGLIMIDPELRAPIDQFIDGGTSRHSTAQVEGARKKRTVRLNPNKKPFIPSSSRLTRVKIVKNNGDPGSAGKMKLKLESAGVIKFPPDSETSKSDRTGLAESKNTH